MRSEKGRILIVVIILVILTAGIIVIRNKRKPIQENRISENSQTALSEDNSIPANEKNIIFLAADKTTVKAGERFDVRVKFLAPSKIIFGSDLVMLYDPEFLATDKINIKNGSFFESVPKKTVDPENGIIKISAFGGKMASEDNDIVNISFTAVKSGTTNLNFAFEKTKTNNTNLVEDKTSKNILEKTEGLTITIAN